MFLRIAIGKTLIRLHVQKQSDLGLRCFCLGLFGSYIGTGLPGLDQY